MSDYDDGEPDNILSALMDKGIIGDGANGDKEGKEKIRDIREARKARRSQTVQDVHEAWVTEALEDIDDLLTRLERNRVEVAGVGSRLDATLNMLANRFRGSLEETTRQHGERMGALEAQTARVLGDMEVRLKDCLQHVADDSVRAQERVAGELTKALERIGDQSLDRTLEKLTGRVGEMTETMATRLALELHQGREDVMRAAKEFQGAARIMRRGQRWATVLSVSGAIIGGAVGLTAAWYGWWVLSWILGGQS